MPMSSTSAKSSARTSPANFCKTSTSPSSQSTMSSQPSQSASSPPGPQRRVLAPEAANVAVRTPASLAFSTAPAERRRQRYRLRVLLCRAKARRRLAAIAPLSLSNASANSLTPSAARFGGDFFERNARAIERGEGRFRPVHVLGQRIAHPAVVAERVERRHRHGIDGVGADQLLDIDERRCRRIFGSGRGPQQPLRLGAEIGEPLPARSGKALLPAAGRRLGVGDRDLAGKPRQRGAFAARPPCAAISCASSLSTAVSMRLTKKLATLAMRSIERPAATRCSNPSK